MPTLRDAAYGMEESLRQVVEYIINRKQNLNKYWILIHAKPFDVDQIINKVIILPFNPTIKAVMDSRKIEFGFLASICFEIDNRAGTQRRLWVLPPDFEVPDELMTDSLMPLSILESAAKMPKMTWD